MSELNAKNVAWPGAVYRDTYAWRKSPYPEVSAATKMIITPTTIPSVENARGMESKPAPMMVLVSEIAEDVLEAILEGRTEKYTVT